MSQAPESLARITWSDPQSGTVKEFVLMEGATATIGRHASNDICIPEQHVSRQHAVINSRSGLFVLTDLGSANGTFLNDQQLAQPLPLMDGDVIRLYVPLLQFSALVSDDQRREAEKNGTLITATTSTGKGKLIITNGPQEGNVIPLLLRTVRIGRATSKADWEIGLQDLSVSRPHARMELSDKHWMLYDLGSSNGTFVNDTPVNEKGRLLRDGDKVAFGNTIALFREA
jgi:pSer/pThr/pTyr-binding forkhead associated (FHA) protein